MNKQIYHVKITFVQPILGTQGNRQVMTDWVGGQLDDEIAALPVDLEKSTTVFHKVNGKPVLFDYQVKGFLKHAASVINGLKTFQTKALKSKVEDHVFVKPRIIELNFPTAGEELEFLERPAQVQTAMGPRVALLRSEMVPEGTTASFTIEVLDGSPIGENIITEILSYGENIGLGQWRNSGKGSFTFEIEKP